MRRALPLLAFALTLGACTRGIDSAVFMPAAPTVAPDEIRIYSSQAPQCEFDEVGIVTWRPTSGFQKLQTGVDRMRERAAEMGGHAIVGFGIGERAGGTTTTIKSDSASVTAKSTQQLATFASGTVIRFRNGGCTR